MRNAAQKQAEEGELCRQVLQKLPNTNTQKSGWPEESMEMCVMGN